MTEEYAVTMILGASCKQDLSNFLDTIQLNLDIDNCEIDDWDLITEVTKSKIEEFDARVFH